MMASLFLIGLRYSLSNGALNDAQPSFFFVLLFQVFVHHILMLYQFSFYCNCTIGWRYSVL